MLLLLLPWNRSLPPVPSTVNLASHLIPSAAADVSPPPPAVAEKSDQDVAIRIIGAGRDLRHIERWYALHIKYTEAHYSCD